MTNRPWKLSLVRSSPNVCIGFVMRLVLRLKNRLLSTFTSATLNASTSKTASLPTKSRARPRNLAFLRQAFLFGVYSTGYCQALQSHFQCLFLPIPWPLTNPSHLYTCRCRISGSPPGRLPPLFFPVYRSPMPIHRF